MLEPTNDLDIETLELLEERLLEYSGTLLVVSHDRALLNNVVTSTLVFEEPGVVREYAGGYDDWLVQRPSPPDDPPRKTKAAPEPRKTARPSQRKKLGYMEKRELAALPARIESLEARQQALFATMSEPDFYRQDGEQIASVKQDLAIVEHELETAYDRWQTLESLDQP